MALCSTRTPGPILLFSNAHLLFANILQMTLLFFFVAPSSARFLSLSRALFPSARNDHHNYEIVWRWSVQVLCVHHQIYPTPYGRTTLRYVASSCIVSANAWVRT